MNTVSEVLGNSGAAITVSFDDGRVLTIKKLDQRGKTEIEQYLKSQARDQLNEDRIGMADAEYALAYGAFLDRVASGDYKFGGRVYTSFVGSGAGGLHLAIQLSSWADGKKLTENEMVELLSNPSHQAKLTTAIQQSIAESFPKATAPAQGRGISEQAA